MAEQGGGKTNALNINKQEDILKNGSSANGGDSITSGDQILNLPAEVESHGIIQGPTIDGASPVIKSANSRFNPFNVFRYSKFGPAAGGYDVTQHNDKALLGGSTAGINTSADDSKKNLFNYIKGAIAPNADNVSDFKVGDYQRDVLNPTASRIIEWSRTESGGKNAVPSGMAPTPYAILDFLHCTHYGKIPNNRLVTVRRYPQPTEDSLKLGPEAIGNAVPLAQAINWYGEGTGNTLESLLPLSWDYKWEDLTSDVKDIDGNEILVDDILAAIGITDADTQNVAAATVAAAQGGSEGILALAGFDEKLQAYIRGAYKPDGPYWNRVLGPVNVINKSRKRIRGMGETMFGGALKVNFSYTLRSFQNQNPKTAFLDLLTNFLTLTYNTAPFWGGGYRYFQKPGVKIGSAGSALIEQGHVIEGIKVTMEEWIKNSNGAASGILNDLMNQFQGTLRGDPSVDVDDSLADKNGNVTTSIADAFAAGRSANLMQTPLTYRSLLEGRPIGDLHMVIGNPMSPMAAVGNLIIKSCSMKLGDKLGADDFPTEITFSLELQHGKPRAKQDIESIFNLGNGPMSFSSVKAPSGTAGTFIAPVNAVSDKRNSANGTLQGNRDVELISAEEIQLKGDIINSNVDTYRDRVTYLWGDKYGDSAQLNDYLKKSAT